MKDKETIPEENDPFDGYADGNADDDVAVADGDDAVMDDDATDGGATDPEPSAEGAMDWKAQFQSLEQQIAELKAAQQTKETPPPPVSDEETVWKSFSDDYPDIAEPVQKLLKRQQEQFAQALDDMRARTFEESMDAARPDWRELANDAAFKTWLSTHTEQQEKIRQPGVRAAMSVIRSYDEHKKAAEATKVKRQERLKAAEAAPAKGSRAPNLSDALDGWAAE